ncbi:hypothetical protein [Neisseria iguanae]|uniref:hypothetical protein n=1 Tax=Neisseria iguanae TaxID=90242 RepID=UPI001B808E2C|nr:hypothetical protein [Neisseria iguanae]
MAEVTDTVSQNNRPVKQGHMHKHGHKMRLKGELPRELQELNLSSTQKTQIQKIMAANR